MLSGYLTADLSYVLFTRRYPQPSSDAVVRLAQDAYWAGNSAVNWLSWTIPCLLGIVLANAIPPAWGLSFAGLLALALGAVYVRDRYIQTSHAVLRNYPVLGHLRYAFEDLGYYFRQYWFTADWEERPFDRMTRAWVYRSSKGVSNYIAFGGEADLRAPGHVLFLHSPFPVNEDEVKPFAAPVIGPGCPNPYTPKSFFNISGMSYGALSSQAVQALSAGAAEAGKAAAVFAGLMLRVRDPVLRRTYRQRMLRLVRRRPDPAVWMVYAIKCAIHSHHHAMATRMASASAPVNTF
jgi:hypothetical protein